MCAKKEYVHKFMEHSLCTRVTSWLKCTDWDNEDEKEGEKRKTMRWKAKNVNKACDETFGRQFSYDTGVHHNTKNVWCVKQMIFINIQNVYVFIALFGFFLVLKKQTFSIFVLISHSTVYLLIISLAYMAHIFIKSFSLCIVINNNLS